MSHEPLSCAPASPGSPSGGVPDGGVAGVGCEPDPVGWLPPFQREQSYDPMLFDYLTDPAPTSLGGYTAITTYDSFQRGGYLQQVKQNSAQAVEAIEAARAAGNPAAADEIARAVFAERNALRSATQQQLSPSGRAMSEAVDQQHTWESMLVKYGAQESDEFATATNIALAAGRSNRLMSRMSQAGRMLGPIGIGYSLGQSCYEISHAPEGQRAEVAGGEVGALAGGAIGGTLGTLGGLALLGAGPPGWLAIGVGTLAGLGGAYVGSERGRTFGAGVGKNFGQAADTPGHLADTTDDWFTRAMSGRPGPFAPR